jgi:hypothetical protein
MTKNVNFNLNTNITHTTYSRQEYDRTCIDHVLYRHAYGHISDDEIRSIYVNLDLYKLYEMSVHKRSFKNNLYHVKKLTIKN